MGRFLTVVLALCACGGVRYTASTTKGVACADGAQAFCDKFIACGQIAQSERAACIDGTEGGCCADMRICGQPVANPTGAADCVNRVPGESCSLVNINTKSLPAYCRQMF